MILLKFDTTINGDSTVTGHDKWITIATFQFGVGRSISTSGVGKDRDTSNPSFSEIVLTKSMDVASVDLMMQAICGKSLGKATLHWIQTGGADVDNQVYLEIELGEAIVSGFTVGSSGDRPSESITINFNTFKMKYSTFGEGSAPVQGELKGWDLKQNKAAA
ncbi:MAG: type VI secretion system tube protein Hcp [Methylococcaceae bacterium]|jgi:type VI secretion system secreted protein Hcp